MILCEHSFLVSGRYPFSSSISLTNQPVDLDFSPSVFVLNPFLSMEELSPNVLLSYFMNLFQLFSLNYAFILETYIRSMIQRSTDVISVNPFL